MTNNIDLYNIVEIVISDSTIKGLDFQTIFDKYGYDLRSISLLSRASGKVML